ncbi:MAG TPA: hypothetical protein ACFYD6_00705 [Candidatus Brocadiia bacterium]|nr:hypothetical protein [Candidatus Brocadiales bacterium]
MDLWSKLTEWLKKNPWWGALGFLLALFSIILAVIFFISGRRTKEPTYAIQSTNLIQDFTSRFEALEITFAGKRISNFTATKVAFWNNGKETINSSDIVFADPLMIKVKNECKILDSSVSHPKEGSNPNQFKIVPSEDGSHVLIQFDYLDKDEGGVIQLLHTGKSSDDVEVCGTVKEYGKPKRRAFPIIMTYGTVLVKRRFIVVFLVVLPFILYVMEFLTSSQLVTKIVPSVMLVILLGFGFYMFKRHVPKGFEISFE